MDKIVKYRKAKEDLTKIDKLIKKYSREKAIELINQLRNNPDYIVYIKFGQIATNTAGNQPIEDFDDTFIKNILKILYSAIETYAALNFLEDGAQD